MWVYADVHMWRDIGGCQRCFDPLELELHAIVSYLMWVLAFRLWSSIEQCTLFKIVSIHISLQTVLLVSFYSVCLLH